MESSCKYSFMSSFFQSTICELQPYCAFFIAVYYYSIVWPWTCHNLLIHFTIDGHLDCCQFWAIINNAAMKLFFKISIEMFNVQEEIYNKKISS